MFANVIKVMFLASLFPIFLNATDVQWPENFTARHYDPPHPNGVYGCIGNNDFHDLILDFTNSSYTKIDMFCRAGDMHFYGSKGYLLLINNNAIKIKTEFVDDAPSMENMEWRPTDLMNDGYFTYVSEKNFDEFDNEGKLLIQW